MWKRRRPQATVESLRRTDAPQLKCRKALERYAIWQLASALKSKSSEVSSMSQKQKRVYDIDSLYCASALLAAGVPLHQIDTTNPARAVFQFTDPKTPEMISRFHLCSLDVDAHTVFARFNDLRNAIKRGESEPRGLVTSR
jgi:hypothetical protein